jgi:hypothetical protein
LCLLDGRRPGQGVNESDNTSAEAIAKALTDPVDEPEEVIAIAAAA